jgi:uncharacterized protein (UPF0264 family)
VRLLVSVRSPDEVRAALRGGADIVDAKDPSRGTLGPVADDVLEAIVAQVPPHVGLSVALGDVGSVEATRAAFGALRMNRRATPYVKLGFGGVSEEGELLRLLDAAADAAARHPARPRLVAVACADRDGSAKVILRGAGQAGAAGILLDTDIKDGRTLLDFWPENRLRDWVHAGRSAGLEVALAGSLGLGDLARIAALGPDIVGVRGAACAGGRSGTVDAGRVHALRARLLMEPAAIAANHQIGRAGPPHQSISK